MESRLKNSRAHQKKFLKELKSASGLTWNELAKICALSDRTLRDWASGKFNMSYGAAKLFSTKFAVRIPEDSKVLPGLWHLRKAASQGGLRRHELYGLLGDIESRRRGGKSAQQRRRDDPEKYRLLGCIVRKKFVIPSYSEDLAELVGIILGDGSISNTQLRITLSRTVDRKYAQRVRNLTGNVLGEAPSWAERKTENTIELTLSGVRLVEVLEELGLVRGNKVRNQVGFPTWVLKEKRYRAACARGLFDTDGGLYFHRHSKWRDKRPYLGWCFSNYSKPLIIEFENTLKLIGLRPKNVDYKKLYMYSIRDISRYMSLVGTRNPKNIEKYDYYKRIRKLA